MFSDIHIADAGGFIVSINFNNVRHLCGKPELILKSDSGIISHSFSALGDVLPFNHFSGIQQALAKGRLGRNVINSLLITDKLAFLAKPIQLLINPWPGIILKRNF